MKTYLFYRRGGFDIVQLNDDQEAKHSAESIRHETYQVQSMDGQIIWRDNNRLN